MEAWSASACRRASSASSCRPATASTSTAPRSTSRMASVFVAQAAEATTGFHMVGQQIVMMLTLMVTSKGVAAVPRASLVILLATLGSFLPANLGPIGVAVIFGVDELMDMGRTCVNVIGNCLATVRRGPLGRRVRRSTGTGLRHAGGNPPRPRRRRARLRGVGADGWLRRRPEPQGILARCDVLPFEASTPRPLSPKWRGENNKSSEPLLCPRSRALPLHFVERDPRVRPRRADCHNGQGCFGPSKPPPCPRCPRPRAPASRG